MLWQGTFIGGAVVNSFGPKGALFLQLYKESDSTCKIILQIINGQTDIPVTQGNPLYIDKGWIQGVPWLYYSQKPSEVLRQSGKVDMTVSFFEDAANKDRNASLTFFIARYHLNGTFLGFQELKDQLNLCPFNYDDVEHMFKFGTVTENHCDFDLIDLIPKGTLGAEHISIQPQINRFILAGVPRFIQELEFLNRVNREEILVELLQWQHLKCQPCMTPQMSRTQEKQGASESSGTLRLNCWASPASQMGDRNAIHDPSSLPKEANLFYELFILDRKGNLIDVPILLRNFNNSKGLSPNTGSSFSDDWRLVRRFFIYDTVSGIDQPNGYKTNSTPRVVRWAHSIKFKITLDSTQPERIYTPYVEVVYRERMANMIHSGTKAKVEFIMDYYGRR